MIIKVGSNGSMLRGVLIGGGPSVNVIIIPAMRSIGLEIEKTFVYYHINGQYNNL